MPSPLPVRREGVETAVLDTVRTLLRELGSVEAAGRVSLRSSLDRDLGLGSLERVELLVRLETALGVRLPESGAQASETPGDWVRAVLGTEAGSERVARWPIVQPSKEAYPPPADAPTFAEVFKRQVERDPARVHIHLLEQDSGHDISHARLYDNASTVAAGLVSSGLRPGETVAIMLPTCEDFFSSFLGVMLAGGVAVPVYPPARPSQIEEYIRRQSQILRNAQVRFLISFDRIRTVASVLEGELPTLREVLGVDELAARGSHRRLPAIEGPETFFIQYTSGSTGNPKGVTLTHANVLANIRGIGFAVKVKPTDAVVTWLPLYHDMGLIGSWLFSLYHGLPITILSPLDFLVRPERWLWALSDSGGTLCPAPNFAFELCMRKIRDESMEGVDLSKWRVAINAGEPVLAATLERFADRFQRWGFDRRSFMPFFGLAESSVALTYPPFWRGPVVDRIERIAFEAEGQAVPSRNTASKDVLEFVGNGRALPGHELRIVGDAGEELPERVRGRIVFRGPSRTGGYYRNPDATAAVLDSDGWLDSGDLGYVADGELYVTGRLKDCIIKGGHNIIPQDVEMAAWEAEGVRKGCVAAFGSIDATAGTEKLVVVVETRVTDPAGRERLRTAVTEAVTTKVGMPPDDVVPVHPGFVPKTSSGKIQRLATRRLYETGAVAGSRGSSAWLQLARVGARGAIRSSIRVAGRIATRSLAAATALLSGSIAVAFGLAARLAPSPAAARYAIAPGARVSAWFAGSPSPGRLAGTGARMVLASRASRIDPLVIAAAFRSAFVFADRTGFRALGAPQAFLLEPLVVTGGPVGLPSTGNGWPQASAEAALAEGWSVVSLANSPVGEPPSRTRFRAECFAAAARVGVPVVPVALRTAQAGTTLGTQGNQLENLELAGSLAEMRLAVRETLERDFARQHS